MIWFFDSRLSCENLERTRVRADPERDLFVFLISTLSEFVFFHIQNQLFCRLFNAQSTKLNRHKMLEVPKDEKVGEFYELFFLFSLL